MVTKTPRQQEQTTAYLRAQPPEYHMYYRARWRARQADEPFTIERSDVVVPELCPYLGIPLFKGEGKQTANSPSIDRIDSAKGYTKGNVEVISNMANAMKYNATPEQLVTFAKAILERYDIPSNK